MIKVVLKRNNFFPLAPSQLARRSGKDRANNICYLWRANKGRKKPFAIASGK